MIRVSIDEWFKFIKDYISQGNRFKMKIFGTSMIPTFQPDDLVAVEKKDIGELEAGDIIVFFSQRKYFIIHRLIQKIRNEYETVLITKGDNNAFVDEYKINEHNYIGVCRCI